MSKSSEISKDTETLLCMSRVWTWIFWESKWDVTAMSWKLNALREVYLNTW